MALSVYSKSLTGALQNMPIVLPCRRKFLVLKMMKNGGFTMANSPKECSQKEVDLSDSSGRYAQAITSFAESLETAFYFHVGNGFDLKEAFRRAFKETSEMIASDGKHISSTMRKYAIEYLKEASVNGSQISELYQELIEECPLSR